MQKVCILGVGRQGSAAAYDILKYNKPQKLLLLDNNHDSLKRTMSKINRVKDDNTEIIAEVIDLNDSQKLSKLLTPFDIFLSAVPYQFNLQLTKVALSFNCLQTSSTKASSASISFVFKIICNSFTNSLLDFFLKYC